MVFHFYFSDRRDHLDDQGKVDSMTVIDISSFFTKVSPGVPTAGYRSPVISKYLIIEIESNHHICLQVPQHLHSKII